MSKLKYLIIGIVVVILIAAIVILNCVYSHKPDTSESSSILTRYWNLTPPPPLEPHMTFDELSDYLDELDLSKHSFGLTIYYIDPNAMAAAPVNEREMVLGVCDLKIEIDELYLGHPKFSYKRVFEKISDIKIEPVKTETYVNARICYILESEKDGVLLRVTLCRDNMFVNGVEIEENEVFYDVIKPFLPEIALKRLEEFLEKNRGGTER